jgi:rubrerythrin
MDERRLVQRLRMLARFDADALAAYEVALRHVDDEAVREKLSGFRLDHARHVQDYNALIGEKGGEPVSLEPKVKGTVLKSLTAASSSLGTRAALMAMLGNEQLTNATYEVMLRMKWPAEVRELIKKNREEERQHLAWMRQAVRTARPAEAEERA